MSGGASLRPGPSGRTARPATGAFGPGWRVSQGGQQVTPSGFTRHPQPGTSSFPAHSTAEGKTMTITENGAGSSPDHLALNAYSAGVHTPRRIHSLRVPRRGAPAPRSRCGGRRCHPAAPPAAGSARSSWPTAPRPETLHGDRGLDGPRLCVR